MRRGDPGRCRGRPGRAAGVVEQGAVRAGAGWPCRRDRLDGRGCAPGGGRVPGGPVDAVLRPDRTLLPGRRDLALRGRCREAHRRRRAG